MGIVYLPKITPSSGQKGFKSGNIFVPVKDLVFPPIDGLIFHFTGKSSTAETGQLSKEEGSSISYSKTIDGIPCATFPATSDFLKYDDIGLIGSFDATVSAWVYLFSCFFNSSISFCSLPNSVYMSGSFL